MLKRLCSLLFTSFLFLTGCTLKKSKVDHHFVFNQTAACNTLDPANAVTQAEIWAVNQFYNGLVQNDSLLNPTPCLAKSWEKSADGLSYTFHLRKVLFADDACFNGDAEQVKPTDIIFTLKRLLDPALAAKGSWVLRNRLDQNNPFSIINDSTLVIRLSKPYNAFLSILSMPYCFILSEKACAFYGKNIMRHPVGTGPFSFKIWKTNEVLIGTKNNHYFEKDLTGIALPYLEGFSMTQIDNKKTEYLKFIQGDIDMMADIDPAFTDQLLDSNAQLNNQVKNLYGLIKKSFLNTEYIGFQTHNPQYPILQNINFRKALAGSINKDEMIKYLRNGLGYTAKGGFVPQGIGGFGNSVHYGILFDIDNAKSLLTQSGYHLELINLSVTPQNQALAEYIVKSWELIGVNAKVEVLQTKSFRDKLVKGDIQAFRGSWIADYGSPVSFLECFYGKNGAPPNYTHFKSETYDKMMNESNNLKNENAQTQLYHKMDSLVMAESIVIPLFYDQSITFIHKNIEGMYINSMDILDLRYIRKKK